MIVYNEQNSVYFIIIVCTLSMFAGVATMFIKLDEEKEEHSKSYYYSVIFQGAFLGATSPLLIFTFLLIVEPVALQIIFKAYKTEIKASSSLLRGGYLIFSLIFSREIILKGYRLIRRKKNDDN